MGKIKSKKIITRQTEIKFIEDPRKRQKAYSKRRAGFKKKLQEFIIETGAEVILIVVPENGELDIIATPTYESLVFSEDSEKLITNCLIKK